jgi:signal transduction histidine kinase
MKAKPAPRTPMKAKPAPASGRAEKLRARGLQPKLIAAIESLPSGDRELLLDWFDKLTANGPNASGLTPADAAFQAVETAVERERKRIGRDLHDGVAADLAAAVALFKLYFEAGKGPAASEESLRHIFEILQGLLEKTRTTLRDMRPRRLGPAKLIDELRKTSDEYARLYGIRVELWFSGREEELTAGQREVVFHVVREALTNVRRHSGSPVCQVRLGFAAKPFLIEVADEGTGLDVSTAAGYGLVGMRERAAGIAGRLEVVSTPGRGTTVFLFGPERPGSY